MFFRTNPLEEKLIAIARNRNNRDILALKKCINDIRKYKGCRKKPSIDARQNGIGGTALNLIALYGTFEMLTALIEARANPNIKDDFGRTALTHAARSNSLEMVKALIQAGAKPDLHNSSYDNTALMVFTSRGNIEMVRLLIASGANVAIMNHKKETALDLCIDRGNSYYSSCTEQCTDSIKFLSLARLLLEEGAEIFRPVYFFQFLKHYIDQSDALEDLLFCLNMLCEKKEAIREKVSSYDLENDPDYLNAKDLFYKLSQAKEKKVIEKIDEGTSKKFPLEIIKLISSFDNPPYRHQLFKTKRSNQDMNENKENSQERSNICCIQ